MESTVAVIDIGMTNKKVSVYDGKLRMLESMSRSFEALNIDGLETHDLAGMEAWFIECLASLASRWRIDALAVTTHGATQVCVGADGLAAAPCVLYTHEPGDEFQERFYATVGNPLELQATTGTPRLSALINPAKALLFMQERFPGALEKTVQVLNYPQYWGFRLTGAYGAEGTYIANHSYLWDWKEDRYSSVAERLGVAAKMPCPPRTSWEVLGRLRPELAARTGLTPGMIVTMGIHDSNASLLPHLAKRRGKDFILNSTGTWCVLMHPQKRFAFEPKELGKVVFFNRSAYLEPVKTAIFLGGMEYERWSAQIARLSGRVPADPGPSAYPGLFERRDAFILPEVVPGSGQFPGSPARAVEGNRSWLLSDIEAGKGAPEFLEQPERAMAALNASLVIQTLVALGRAGLSPGTEVITEGGFRKNGDYNGLLAAALRDNPVRLTDIAEATSLGAAMTALAALRATSPDALSDKFDIAYLDVAPMEGAVNLGSYIEAWHQAMDRTGPQAGQ